MSDIAEAKAAAKWAIAFGTTMLHHLDRAVESGDDAEVKHAVADAFRAAPKMIRALASLRRELPEAAVEGAAWDRLTSDLLGRLSGGVDQLAVEQRRDRGRTR